MKQNGSIFQTKKLKTFLRIMVILMTMLLIIASPLKVATGNSNSFDLNEMIPKPNESSGAEFFTTVGRGLYNTYIPAKDEINSMKYNKWSTMDDIADGLEVLDTIVQLENGTPQILDDFLTNNTVNKLVQVVFSERSNNTDLWWGTFNKTIEAASILQRLGAMNDTLSQLNEQMNYTLQLADYYSVVNQKTVVVNNVTVPGWTLSTLKDLLKYRITSFLSSRPISFDTNSTNYFNNIDEAINLGLVNFQDLQLQQLSASIINGRNKQSLEILNGNTTENEYNYYQSDYQTTEEGVSGQNLVINDPLLRQVASSLFTENNYDQLMQNYRSPLQLSISLSNNIPNKLITYDNYRMGLIYYTNSEMVTYNITIPDDTWGYDANGSLVYISNSTIEQMSYYKPVGGTWVNNNTFVPDQQSPMGMWVFNTSIMQKPDSYRVTLNIPNMGTSQQEFTRERVQNDDIRYITTLPIGTNSNYKVNVTIEQLDVVSRQQNGTHCVIYLL